MEYRQIGTDPQRTRRVSAIALGAMLFGTRTDESTSNAILDRYVEAGGTFVDTANNYAFWVNGTQGGESESLVGEWRRSRGISDELVLATKVGGRPLEPATSFSRGIEGLEPANIAVQADLSRERLGVEQIDVYYAHIHDLNYPLDEQVEAFGRLVEVGAVGLLGVSNHYSWRVERARSLAKAAGVAAYDVLQYEHSYLRPRTDQGTLRSDEGQVGVADGGILSYLRAEPELAMVAYSPLLKGAYTHPDRLDPRYDHPGTVDRLAALGEVASETGATANQVVLAYLMGGELPIIPLVGASSVAQLDESLAAVDVKLSDDQRARLDAAGSDEGQTVRTPRPARR